LLARQEHGRSIRVLLGQPSKRSLIPGPKHQLIDQNETHRASLGVPGIVRQRPVERFGAHDVVSALDELGA
jgi:hypothetical protein